VAAATGGPPGLGGHRAHRLDAADVFAADRVFTMTRGQAETLRERFPDQAGRIRALDPDVDVFDPFGRGREAYDEVLAQLRAAVGAEVARCVPLGVALAADGAGAALAHELAERLRRRAATRLLAETAHPGAFAAATLAAAALGDEGGRPAAFAIVVAQPAPAAYVAANRLPGVRAAWCRRIGEARSARADCDANLLCLAPQGRSAEGAAAIVEAFLQTPCQGGAALAWLAEMRRGDATRSGG
jgi:ribose 5-phosphate isomerase RpiB